MIEKLGKPLTVREVADKLRISLATAYSLVSKGKIASHRIGGAIRVFESALETYLAASVQQAPAPLQARKPIRIQLKHLRLK